MNQAAGDSTEQREAEAVLVACLGARLGVSLMKKIFQVPGGGRLEVDGVCEAPPVLCEAWAHQGPPKSAQRHKVMADALKLLFVAQLISGPVRKILLFGDLDASLLFKSKSWVAQALEANGIEVHVIDLPEATRAVIRQAQRRQFR